MNYDIIIYHKACNDGFACAYIANKYLGDAGKTYTGILF